MDGRSVVEDYFLIKTDGIRVSPFQQSLVAYHASSSHFEADLSLSRRKLEAVRHL